jgi:hypothetical protein
VHSSATRRAAAMRFGGSDFQSKVTAKSLTRCGSSPNYHRTSITRSSTGIFACVAQELMTEKMHDASELPSMWKGE